MYYLLPSLILMHRVALSCLSNHLECQYKKVYPMTWLGTARILYHGILRCRPPQCRDVPSVAMCILLLLVLSTMASWQHQLQTLDMMMSQSYLWHHNGLECCDIINMPHYGVMASKVYEWVIIYTSLYMWFDYYNKNSAHGCRWRLAHFIQ